MVKRMNEDTHPDRLQRLDELPRGIEPPRDLWPGIAARLQAAAPVQPAARLSAGSHRWVPLAAAASLFIAVGAALFSYQAMHATPTQNLAWAPAVPSQQVAHIEQLHAAERARLRGVLADRATSMDAQTLATLRENLEIMDRASEEIRAAIKAHPRNGQWVNLLLDNYQQEFDMLNYVLQEQPYTNL